MLISPEGFVVTGLGGFSLPIFCAHLCIIQGCIEQSCCVMCTPIGLASWNEESEEFCSGQIRCS